MDRHFKKMPANIDNKFAVVKVLKKTKQKKPLYPSGGFMYMQSRHRTMTFSIWRWQSEKPWEEAYC